MKSMQWERLLLMPLIAQAADVRQDYRQQWPLQVAGLGAGMYQLSLNDAIYRSVHDAGLRDVTVIDARGEEVPTATSAGGCSASRCDPPAARAVVCIADGCGACQRRSVADCRTRCQWRWKAALQLAYRLGNGAAAASPPQRLSAPVRDRQWRLLAAQRRSTAVPTPRVGYPPERVIFLAQGQPPYAVVAGSARVTRRSAAGLDAAGLAPRTRGAMATGPGQHRCASTAAGRRRGVAAGYHAAPLGTVFAMGSAGRRSRSESVA